MKTRLINFMEPEVIKSYKAHALDKYQLKETLEKACKVREELLSKIPYNKQCVGLVFRCFANGTYYNGLRGCTPEYKLRKFFEKRGSLQEVLEAPDRFYDFLICERNATGTLMDLFELGKLQGLNQKLNAQFQNYSELRHQLVLGSMSFLFKFANKIGQSRPDLLEDLVAEGREGVYEAIDSFDPRYRTTLLTYAGAKIKNKMTRLLRRLRTKRIPAYIYDNLTRINQTQDILSQRNPGVQPTSQEIAELAKLSFNLVRRSAEATMGREVPLRSESGEEHFPHQHTDSLSAVMKSENYSLLHRAISELEGRDLDIINLRFGLNGEEPLTLEETGRRLNLSRERIRVLEQNTLQQLAIKISSYRI